MTKRLERLVTEGLVEKLKANRTHAAICSVNAIAREYGKETAFRILQNAKKTCSA